MAWGEDETRADAIARKIDRVLDDEVRAQIAAAFEGGAGAETGRRVLEAVAVEPADGEAVRAFASRVRERAGAILPRLEEER